MDRTALETMLGEGLSLAEIGRRVGRHESTVAYWLAKYGLRAVGHERNAPRGGLARPDLETLVEAGFSAAHIAEALERSKTTVRYWLLEYGMTTAWATRRQASARREQTLTLDCARHGSTTFARRGSGGYRCCKCRAEAVARRRRKIKRLLVDEAGGSCCICGYERCLAALHFHHVDPTSKRFALSNRGVTRSLERARAEARKCVLLCSNCHTEVEAGAATIPDSM